MHLKTEIRILYVEDIPADVVMVNHELRQAGLDFRAKRVETKEDFLYELEHHVPDIIISDHGLPRFDGFSALAMAKQKCPDVPFIFVTGSRGEEVAVQTFERGAADYVLKGNLSRLVPAIRRALENAAEREAHKQQEDALRENEARLRLLVDGIRDFAIFMLDPSGRVTSWNSGAKATYGYEDQEVLGQHFALFYLPEDVKRARPALNLRAAVLSERFEEDSFRIGKNDSRFHAHIAITALYNPAGHLVGFTHLTRDISERRRTADAQRRREALATAILDTALDAVISIDHHARVQEWNPAAQRLFGYAREEALGRPLDEIIVPESLRNVYHDGLTHYLLTGAGSLIGRPIELLLRRKDEVEFSAELSISRAPTEEPLRCTAIIRDITERKKMEAALRESEERYRRLVEGVKDYAIYLLDPAGRVASWNAGAERIAGFKAEEIVGKPLSAFFTVLDRERDWPGQILGKATAEGRWAYEGWQVRKDNVQFWCQGTLTALRDPDGQLVGFSIIARDLTAHMKAEEGLRRLAAIVEFSDDAIYSASLEDAITSWNPGATRLFGYLPEEVIGQPIFSLVPPGRVEEERRLSAQIKRGETVAYFETVRRRKDGSLVDVSVTLSPIRDAAGRVIGASQIARDITVHKQAEEQIRRLNLDLERRVRERTGELEASNRDLEAFSYSVSHDLRAPLRHVIGYVEILESQAAGRLNRASQQSLRTIAAAASQMNQLVDALLEFSRMGRTEMRFVPIRLNTLVEEARQELFQQTGDRVIDWEIDELPATHGDPVMLRQVFVNLISNAIKYTRPRARTKIEIGGRIESDGIICYVRDNGVGFSMDYADKLFGVFQRLHRTSEFEGTGIGLANVHRIIQRHGGRTWAEGTIDAGATFYFSLPRRSPDARAVQS
jgi:PAS domain S-box-containing protein